jgi:hypothetical protein
VKKEVFDKLDEERMADYGHSRAYQLMPHFNDCLESNRRRKAIEVGPSASNNIANNGQTNIINSINSPTTFNSITAGITAATA